MERGFKKLACTIMGITQRSYSNYFDQNRPIINLLEKYFSKQDLEEYLETGSIKKIERLKELEEIEKKYLQIISIIKDNKE
jgi:predicted transcriptional regulator